MPVVQLERGGRAVGRRISKAFPNGPPGASAPRTMQDRPEKRLHFRGLFISSAVTAWKANPRRPLRHGAAPVQNASPQSAKARQGGQRMAYRSKRRPARRAESKTGGGESISSAGDSDENRPKSVCTFDFGGPKSIADCFRPLSELSFSLRPSTRPPPA